VLRHSSVADAKVKYVGISQFWVHPRSFTKLNIQSNSYGYFLQRLVDLPIDSL